MLDLKFGDDMQMSPSFWKCQVLLKGHTLLNWSGTDHIYRIMLMRDGSRTAATP